MPADVVNWEFLLSAANQRIAGRKSTKKRPGGFSAAVVSKLTVPANVYTREVPFKDGDGRTVDLGNQENSVIMQLVTAPATNQGDVEFNYLTVKPGQSQMRAGPADFFPCPEYFLLTGTAGDTLEIAFVVAPRVFT